MLLAQAGFHLLAAICRALTAQALALKARTPGAEDETENLPEFEIADDTYVDSRESKSTLKRELTLKAFSETGISAEL